MGGGSKTQTQTSEVKLPAWVENASLQNYNFAQNVAAQPYQAYTGQTVAGFSPDQISAMDYARNNVGAYQPVYDAGVNYANQSAAYQPDQVGAAQVNYGYAPDRVRGGQFQDADVSGYMNPYMNEVEANAIRNLQGATQLAVNKIGDQAAAAKAYGGSRQGISEGVTIAEGTKQAGELSAKLRADAYDRALQQITADQNRALQANLANQQTGLAASRYGLDANLANQQAVMQAQLANQSAGLQNANRQLNAAQAMAGIADQGRKSMTDDVVRMLTLGQMQQEQEQKYLDDAYSRFMEARDYPKEQLNILLAALGMSPYGRTQTTTSTANSGTDIGGILGGAGTAAAGMAKLLPLLMGSDEKMKTDIEKVGKDKDSGLDVYAYRYKGDPKTYPKVVGLMADDIEKKMPNEVAEVGGKKAVKFNPAVSKDRIIPKKG